MSNYVKHVFNNGDILTAEQLNVMNDQIELNANDVEQKANLSGATFTGDVYVKQTENEYVIINPSETHFVVTGYDTTIRAGYIQIAQDDKLAFDLSQQNLSISVSTTITGTTTINGNLLASGTISGENARISDSISASSANINGSISASSANIDGSITSYGNIQASGSITAGGNIRILFGGSEAINIGPTGSVFNSDIQLNRSVVFQD